MIPTLFILMLGMSIMLGFILIAIGGYVWLAAKKMIAGILLLAVGLTLTAAPIAVIAFFTITTSLRG
jgi:NADH:ubiquinone oxidoreductase subunit K